MEINRNPLSGHPVGAVVRGLVLLQSCRFSISKNHKTFMVWDGLDITGSHVYGTFFGPETPNYQFPKFDTRAVLDIQGTVGQGQNGISIWATAINQVADPAVMAEFRRTCFPTVPVAELSRYIESLTRFSQSFSNPEVQKLSNKMFEFFLPYLPTHPAGKAIHEPVRGGLAKHTYEVVNLCTSPILMEKGLNRDILVFAALYHDIGKTQEYTEDMTYTENGRLIPHSVIGVQIITKILLEAGGDIVIDPQFRRQIFHCLMSHHGEFSEVRPATKEALVLHYADNMMCRLGHIEEMVRQNQIGADGWGSKSYVLDTTPYVPELDDRVK